MKECPKCGFRDNPYWRHSRFDYNADYMSWDDFQREFPKVAELLKDRKNHDPVELFGYCFYRRGTGGLEVTVLLKKISKCHENGKAMRGFLVGETNHERIS